MPHEVALLTKFTNRAWPAVATVREPGTVKLPGKGKGDCDVNGRQYLVDNGGDSEGNQSLRIKEGRSVKRRMLSQGNETWVSADVDNEPKNQEQNDEKEQGTREVEYNSKFTVLHQLLEGRKRMGGI